jgi:MFS transporter, DHA1 family, tetracycline resistance protein
MHEPTDQTRLKLGAVRREAAFAFIFVTVLLDMLAIGIVIPVVPKLVVDFLSGNAEEAAKVVGIFGTAWASMQFLVSPLQGALSDSFGRRSMILLSNFGLGLDYVLMALAPTLVWLFVGRVISGIAAASISTAHAYVADVTVAEKRAGRFGLLGAAIGVGFVLGPALGGLAGTISPRLPFWIAAGLSLANAFYGLVILPESLPRDGRSRFDWRRANPFGALALLRSHTVLFGLAAVHFLSDLAHVVLPSISVLYMMYRYGWNQSVIGLTLAAVGVASIVVQSLVVGPVTRRVGERVALIFGLIFGVIGFSVFALAPTGPIFWLGIPLMALWGLEGTAGMALMSQLVGSSEQGRLQGAISCAAGIANLIGPLPFTLTFAFAIGNGRNLELAGAPFLIATGLLSLAAILAWWVTRKLSVRPAV